MEYTKLKSLTDVLRQKMTQWTAREPVIESSPDIARGLESIIALGNIYGIDMGNIAPVRQRAE